MWTSQAMPQRPRTALPREPLFNHTVGMDVWFLRQHPVLHVCCLFSRYSQGAVLQSKEAVNVSRAFLDKWIKYFGVPGIVLTDLGGEFENDVVRTMADRYRIELRTAASGAHWSMVGVERQHTKLRTLSEMLLKVYPSMSLSECVDLTHMGKNFSLLQNLGIVHIRLCSVLVPGGRIMTIVIHRPWAPMRLRLITWGITWFILCHNCIRCGSSFMQLM